MCKGKYSVLKAPPLAFSKDETELGINNVYHALIIHKINRPGTECVPGSASARKGLAIRFYSTSKVVRNVLFRIRHLPVKQKKKGSHFWRMRRSGMAQIGFRMQIRHWECPE